MSDSAAVAIVDFRNNFLCCDFTLKSWHIRATINSALQLIKSAAGINLRLDWILTDPYNSREVTRGPLSLALRVVTFCTQYPSLLPPQIRVVSISLDLLGTTCHCAEMLDFCAQNVVGT